MKIERLSALQSNYIFLLINEQDREAIAIDPGQAQPVLDRLQQLGLPLVAIWHTHHHRDHIGGDRQLLAHYPQAKVYGNQDDAHRIPLLTDFVDEGDRLTVGNRTAQVIAVPGHTLTHLAYYFPPVSSPSGSPPQPAFPPSPPLLDSLLHPSGNSDIAIPNAASDETSGNASGDASSDASKTGELFCGDTLFSMGCGRLFEGTPQEMMRSLDKFRQLPDNTRVWCAHEYTESNLKFARTLLPNDRDLHTYETYIQQRRQKRQATIPGSLAIEKRINPFLRWDAPELQAALDSPNNPIRTFRRLRGRKDLF